MISKEVLGALMKPCHCGLFPQHVTGLHDWCCQNCGGAHDESICPGKKYECPYGPTQIFLGVNCSFKGSFKEIKDHVPVAHADQESCCSHHHADPDDQQLGICPYHDLGFKA
jgi:hypothetical protein